MASSSLSGGVRVEVESELLEKKGSANVPEDSATTDIGIVSPRIIRQTTNMREPIEPRVRLAITLKYLATGDSYTSLQFFFKVSVTTIARIVPEVCACLIEVLGHHVKIPSTREDWLRVSNQFELKWNFPHAIGAIDGKHVRIQAPKNSGSEYFNYKHFYSVVLMAIVDADYNFLYADVGCPGRMSDGGAFQRNASYRIS
ncbi:uncharacterized protein LOC131284856 [Anopheles ziemanni]|uniref:uncharacterized protein LOC131261983 n=1 Tax=Anopheles coustani TaxID=139045 RepID=UPI0026596318|nr:uncharacterized protein LOC131261983 [Anopheles coustani]XP_058169698.1 uncharacterized protein LOC131284856 [Anopheles ziemanni]